MGKEKQEAESLNREKKRACANPFNRMIIFSPQGRKPQMFLTEMPCNDGGLCSQALCLKTQIKNSGLCEILDYVCTRSRNRTGTALSSHRILSPACLPVSPPGQVVQIYYYSVLDKAVNYQFD